MLARKKFSRKQLLAYTANLPAVADWDGSVFGSALYRAAIAARGMMCA